MSFAQPDELIIGGYEEEEQQPDPFVALSYSSTEEFAATVQWIHENGKVEGKEVHNFSLEVSSVPSGDLHVTLRSLTGETLCEAEVWKDEMWTIFTSYFNQVGRVLLMFAIDGVVEPQPRFVIPREQIQIHEEKIN